MTDLSKQLGLKTGYVSRILSLNSLAPDIVEVLTYRKKNINRKSPIDENKP